MSENPTKICHITSAHPPFDGRIFHKQCISLVNAGYAVSLVATYSKAETIRGVKMVPLSQKKGRFYRFFIKSFQAFFKALKTKSAIYHLHDPELLPAAIALKMCGKKVVFDMHELVYHQIADKDYIGNKAIRKVLAGSYRLLERIGMRVFDKIVLAEDGYLRYFEKNYPKRLHKLVFIRNYPIIGLIDSMIGERQQHQHTTEFILVYAGSLTKIRGIKETCEAVRASKYPVKLVLLGRWSDLVYKEQCGIDGEKINYLGEFPLDKVYDVLSNSDLGVSLLYPVENYLTSLPVKAFEYMACGIPMIMSDFPYWQKTFDGVAKFANPYAVEEITKLIDWSYENKNELAKMGAFAYDKVRKEFSWEGESIALVSMYDGLCGRLPKQQ